MSYRPDLDDPAQRQAYRRELVAFKRPLRWLGLSIVMVGMVFIAWPRIAGWWVMVGPVPLQSLGWTMMAIGWLILLGYIVLRTRYHRKRMAEDKPPVS